MITPLVITTNIVNYNISKILIDNGSSVDITYHHALHRMDLHGMQMELCKEAPLYGFGNKLVDITGTITLLVVIGQDPCRSKIDVKFYVLKVPSAYNVIFNRTTLTAL